MGLYTQPRRRPMSTRSTRNDLDGVRDTILNAEEPDAAIAAWTLDELDDLADLGSVRFAVAGTDEG
jgi:hypothetical protein